MPTAVLTDRERTAVQAYLRLLHTVRAAFGDEGPGPAGRPCCRWSRLPYSRRRKPR